MSLQLKSTLLLEKQSPPNSEPDISNPPIVIKILNIVLADEAILSFKTRNARWNISGERFFDLYSIYQVQQKQLLDISEELSLRIQMLDGVQIGSFMEFLSFSRIKDQPGKVIEGHQLLDDHQNIIQFLRQDYKQCSKDLEDISSTVLISNTIRQHEKMSWMLRSYFEAH